MNHSFKVSVTPEDTLAFARLSGDWNPLHTDPAYAKTTNYGAPMMHGAFSSGLVSRMAGMHIPGKQCLLQSMRLRFVKPMIPPATLKVSGKLTTNRLDSGRVEVSIDDDRTGIQYVDASYEFSTHVSGLPPEAESNRSRINRAGPFDISSGSLRVGPFGISSGSLRAGEDQGKIIDGTILITGAAGGIGRALRERLGPRSTGVSRQASPGLICVPELEKIETSGPFRNLNAIVHCAWPKPDNRRLTDLEDSAASVNTHVAEPLRQIIALTRLLAECGKPDAVLILIGSAFARPGHHAFRMPLYSLSKSLIPTLTQILALELARSQRRCVALVFDVIDGGMNSGLSGRTQMAHADRVPSGKLPTPADAADQIIWILENRSHLLSGASIALTGGALP